jgi:hypothetical protein
LQLSINDILILEQIVMFLFKFVQNLVATQNSQHN